jgi:hypothetical protein
MKRIDLDNAHAQVRKFFRSLELKADGAALVLDGKIIGKLLPPYRMTEAETKAFLEQRMQLIRHVQRSRGVPAHITERLIQEAVDEVRGRKNSN